jgi:hypothetical protein
VIEGDWRAHRDALVPPETASGDAWLFSLDPLKFVRGHRQQAGVVDGGDLADLAEIAAAYASSKRPGCWTLFVYGMFKPERAAFYAAVEELFANLFSSMGVLTVADGAKRHIALLLTDDDTLLRAAAEQTMPVLRGAISDRDPAQALPWNFYERQA